MDPGPPAASPSPARTLSRCYAEKQVSEPTIDRQAWRVLPHERVLWHGRRVPWVSRDPIWTVVPTILASLALIFGAFAGLLWAAELPAAGQIASFAVVVVLFAVVVALAPRYLYDPCEYLVTDRRVIWKRGWMKRSIETSGLSYARIRWHRSAPGVGHLELVRAVPFGPLARQHRIQLLDVRAPDVVFALIRGVPHLDTAGASDIALVERLDPGEELLWSGRPQGWLIGWREIGIAALGVIVIGVGLSYGYRAAGTLVGLEELGLSARSWTWVFFFVAIGITWGLITSIGAGLLWYGLWRARRMGRDTEYMLTDQRVLIRRGRTELSVDRRRIVDVADTRSFRGYHNLYLMLDAPGSRALADSGALGRLPPPREAVPPVLYELRDVDRIKHLILDRQSRPCLPPVEDAA